jgi:hypothetical protein
VSLVFLGAMYGALFSLFGLFSLELNPRTINRVTEENHASIL